MDLQRLQKQQKKIKKIYQVDYEKMQLLLTKMTDKRTIILQDIKRREDENDKYFQKVTYLDEQLL